MNVWLSLSMYVAILLFYLFKGVQTENMRAQGYDGVSNMAGIHRGVQARIWQVVPEAVYTHCKKNMTDTVQQVAFAFNYSAKPLLHFREMLAGDEISKDSMEERTKLRTLWDPLVIKSGCFSYIFSFLQV